MENNLGALPCGCDLQGSTSLSCASFGGQCTCKPNVIGRRCTQCKPGTYRFPDCLRKSEFSVGSFMANCIPVSACNCDTSQQCDPHTGQCFCPPHVEGKNCDRCIPQAYGYDPLIGCQVSVKTDILLWPFLQMPCLSGMQLQSPRFRTFDGMRSTNGSMQMQRQRFWTSMRQVRGWSLWIPILLPMLVLG